MAENKKMVELLIYTRRPELESYPAGLAYSAHFAWRKDGGAFTAFHNNYGILFCEGNIRSNNTIGPKGIRMPELLELSDGKYGIKAVRVYEDGSADEACDGTYPFWTTEDFIQFTYCGLYTEDEIAALIRQETEADMTASECQNGLSECEELADEPEKQDAHTELDELAEKAKSQNVLIETEAPVEGAMCGNSVWISEEIWNGMKLHWDALYHTETMVPGPVEVSSREELDAVTVSAVYNDGSSVKKRVVWDSPEVKFDVPGEYTVHGTVTDRVYPFPLAKGYGDPVLFPWEGKYYFLGTNDNLDDIGIYTRVADEPEGLFAEDVEEHLILPYDEERGFIQTFWAPEFHVIGGELYILFAIGGKVWGPQCHLMKLKKGGNIINAADWEDPIRIRKADGSYLAYGDADMLSDSQHAITLDMTYLETPEKSYVIWSYREYIGTPLDSGSMIYIASVDTEKPWILTSEPVLLTRPLYGWENLCGTINNEGPYAFISGNTVYVTYSGGAANAYTYAVGLLTADLHADLLDISAWTKSNTPVLTFKSIEGVYGPGHNAFFTDPEGNLMISYHAETELKSNLRCDAVHRVHFNAKGEPVFDMAAERDLNPQLRDVEMKIVIR